MAEKRRENEFYPKVSTGRDMRFEHQSSDRTCAYPASAEFAVPSTLTLLRRR